jgi:hypothetical protein
MKRNILILSCLAIILVSTNSASADCAQFGGFTSFSLTGGSTVVLYAESTPVAQFDVPDCVVLPSSQIQLLKGYMCDGDELLIDDIRCVIIAVRALY